MWFNFSEDLGAAYQVATNSQPAGGTTIAAAGDFIAGTEFDRSFIKNGETIRTGVYPDPIWILPGFIPTVLTILARRPKVGKSWFILQIAQAVQVGGRIFGVSIPKGWVLYLALEDNERRLQERMSRQRWATAAGVDFVTMPDFRANIGALHKGGWLILSKTGLTASL